MSAGGVAGKVALISGTAGGIGPRRRAQVRGPGRARRRMLIVIVRFAPEGVWGLLAQTARRTFLRRAPQPRPVLDRE